MTTTYPKAYKLAFEHLGEFTPTDRRLYDFFDYLNIFLTIDKEKHSSIWFYEVIGFHTGFCINRKHGERLGFDLCFEILEYRLNNL